MKAFIAGAALVLLMIPLTAASASALTKEEKIAQALLPLPEDLKGGAAIIEYDEKTGDRVVLRAGTNFVECTPKDKDGFAWCFARCSFPMAEKCPHGSRIPFPRHLRNENSDIRFTWESEARLVACASPVP